MILSLFDAHRWRDWERIDLAKSGRPIRRKMANRDRREEERMEWKWKGGFRRVFGFLGDAFEIFFEGGISLCIYRVTEKLVDPIKCRKAFKEGGEGRGSRRAGRTGLDGAIN